MQSESLLSNFAEAKPIFEAKPQKHLQTGSERPQVCECKDSANRMQRARSLLRCSLSSQLIFNSTAKVRQINKVRNT